MMDRGSGLTRGLFRLMEWITCHFADRVLAVSNSVADLMVREKDLPSMRRSRFWIAEAATALTLKADSIPTVSSRKKGPT